MKGFRFISAMLAMVLVFGMVLSGCATTRSIDFAMDTQPAGVYRQVQISVNSSLFGNASVLQRFYEQYPASQYEVIAYEKVSKDWMIGVGVGAGVLLGSLPLIMGADISDTEVPIIAVSLTAIGTLGGYIWHQIAGNNYVVTYVERQGIVPLTTQGPQG